MRYESKKGENVEDKSLAEHYATDYGQMAHPSFGCFFQPSGNLLKKLKKLKKLKMEGVDSNIRMPNKKRNPTSQMTDGEVVLETYSVLKEEKLSYYLSDKSLSSFFNVTGMVVSNMPTTPQ